jgi:hypothetical protein
MRTFLCLCRCNIILSCNVTDVPSCVVRRSGVPRTNATQRWRIGFPATQENSLGVALEAKAFLSYRIPDFKMSEESRCSHFQSEAVAQGVLRNPGSLL